MAAILEIDIDRQGGGIIAEGLNLHATRAPGCVAVSNRDGVPFPQVAAMQRHGE